MKKSISIINAFKLLLVAILILSIPIKPIEAKTYSGETIAQAAGKDGQIDDNKVAEVDVQHAESITTTMPGAELNPSTLNVGDSFKTIYEGVEYFDTKLNVVVETKLLDKGYIKDDGDMTIYFKNSDKKNYVGINKGLGSTFEVTISFFDTENKEYGFTGLLGFFDPDESNYLFDTTDRVFYYIPNNGKDNENGGPDYAQDGYIVKTDGLYNSTVDGIAFTEENYDLIQTKAQFWTGAKFFIELNSEKSFTFTQETFASGNAVYPFLYSWKYNIEYELNGGTNNPTNPTSYIGGQEKDILDPTKEHYRFTGWTRTDITDPESDKNSHVKTDDTGDKKFVAEWVYNVRYYPNYPAGITGTGSMDDDMDKVDTETYNLTENGYSLEGYKFTGWTTKDDGTGTKYEDKASYKDLMKSADVIESEVIDDVENSFAVLYGNWEPIQYIVKYDPNGGTGHMDDQKPLNYNQDYNLTPNAYEREGYSWVGWNTSADKSGQDYVDKEGFRNLTTKDGDTVTMYAQWEPWKYYVKYDPNGGEGTMNPQTFNYPDPTMRSKENEFTRSGYEFIGFEFEHKGAKYIITSVKDFKDMLKELGPNSTITLVAQWRKLPDPVVKYYNLPVTGVDR